jgi:1-acyl-sn-glycerol-3-phosphate acyltransferase
VIARRATGLAILAAEALFVAAAPVLALVAALLGRRALRVLAIGHTYAVEHLRATAACARLRGAGEHAHYDVLRRLVSAVYDVIVRVTGTRVAVEGSADAEAALRGADRPLVVLSLHAGEGDTLVVIHHLLCRWGRRPRIVMHERLRLDPLIDALGSRLPHRFVDPRGGDTEVEIAAMARGLPPDGAVLIFPEGRNFSPQHRLKSILRLRRAGHHEEAGWAEEMRHVSAPRPGGALAAIEAAPEADIVFVAHAGFPRGLADAWRRLAQPSTVRVRLWLARAGELPDGHDARIDWLFAWWRTLDDWVGSAQATSTPASASQSATGSGG